MTERKVVTIAEITGLVGDGSALNLANRSLTELPGNSNDDCKYIIFN